MVWFNDNRPRRWDPLGLGALSSGFEGLFPEMFSTSRSGPPASVFADEERVVVRAEVPGFGPGDVEVTLEGRVLTLRGERSGEEDGAPSARLTFERRFRLPFRAEPQGVEARLENGMLEVELARAEAERPRRIEIAGTEES